MSKNIMGAVNSVLITSVLLLAGILPASAQEDSGAHFGTSVVISTGLRGEIYYIPETSLRLPNLQKMKPVGSIYTNELNIGIHSFLEGFPGVTDRFEWFAIDYNGRFWIENPGKYTFVLLSDDGSKLYIDGHTSIDNDGVHGARAYAASVKLKQGFHQIRVSYFQGPRTSVALILAYRPPGEEDFLVFNTDDFLPPQQRTELTHNNPDLAPDSPGWKHKRQPAEPLIMAPTIP